MYKKVSQYLDFMSPFSNKIYVFKLFKTKLWDNTVILYSTVLYWIMGYVNQIF